MTYVMAGVTNMVRSDVTRSVMGKVMRDVTLDVTRLVTGVVEFDVSVMVTRNVGSKVAPNVHPVVSSKVTSDVTPDVERVVNCEVARDVTPGVVHWTGPVLRVVADRRRHPQFPVDSPGNSGCRTCLTTTSSDAYEPLIAACQLLSCAVRLRLIRPPDTRYAR